MADRPVVTITAQHKALTEFCGDWRIHQRFFTGPKAEPIINKGKATAKVLLGGRVSFMHSELENGYQAAVMSTWNPTAGRFEGAFIDIFSFDGFDPLMGLPVGNLPTAKGSRLKVSREKPSQERVWSSRLTVPRFTVIAEGIPGILAGVDEIPVQITENQISQNEWLLTCVSLDALTGEQFVQMENTYSRA